MTVSRGAAIWATWLVPLGAWLTRGLLGCVLQGLLTRIAAPPESGMRSQAKFHVQVGLRRGEHRRSLTLSGWGMYDLTAEIIAYAASQLAQPNYDRSGVLPPAVALDPQALLDHAVAHWGVNLALLEENPQ